MRILIATHGHMASGVKSTLSIFTDTTSIQTIDAYVDDRDYTEDMQKFIDDTKDDEVSIIFTDLLGGSVNQKAVVLNNKENVHIIAGFNVSIILEIMLSNITGVKELEEVIEKGRQQMLLVKQENLKNIVMEDEDSFFG